jgi:hypothetical protein
MSQEKKVQLKLEINTEDNTPIIITSIQVNGKNFFPEANQENKNPGLAPKEKIDEIPISIAPLVPLEMGMSDSEKSEKFDSESISVEKDIISEDLGGTLEEFGGNSFYRIFWGKLTYQMLDSKLTKVTYEGQEDVFNWEFVGKWLEPSRIHRCSTEFPLTGRNYFPGSLSVVYSRVLEVLDGKNLLVDFAYNGGNLENPVVARNQDGIFFFDNKFAIESWGRSAKNTPELHANSGQIYASLGMPALIISPNSSLKFVWNRHGLRPAIHLMMSDAFNGDIDGKGEKSPVSYSDTFGDNSSFFHLPDHGEVKIDFDWQFIPPTYAHKVVQYGVPGGAIFFDKSMDSRQYGLKRVANYDQFRIRNWMAKELGFVRPGVSFSMPNQGYCNGGGIHDGREVKEFCTYRFEGDWVSKDPNAMKARTSGGLKVEWIGKSKEEPGRFIEMESLKTSRFDNLKFRFPSQDVVEVDDPNFTWYHFASQEWTGGTSASSEYCHIQVEGRQIGLNSNGDFWLLYGDNNVECRGFGAFSVKLFDKIPKQGDLLLQDLNDLKNNGLIGKPANDRLEVWGWSIQPGDQLSSHGQLFSVTKTERKWKTWEKFSEQFSNPAGRLKRSDRRVTYTEITLDREIAEELKDIKLEWVSSVIQHLLDGKYRGGCSAIWGSGNDAPGHLMYTDYNVNLKFQNITIRGMIRSTSRSLWAETKQSITGFTQSISLKGMDSEIWEKGHRLILAHPESGIQQEIEVAEKFIANSGILKIIPLEIAQEFPENSVVTALYSLCSEAEFENVHYVNEDLTPCYSERIDYRPQGLRLRQLITSNPECRVKIKGGRLSWYSNLDNRFEPEVEFSDHPHLVNPKSVIPVILNPIFKDGKGAKFGYQYKQQGKEELYYYNRLIARGGTTIDLSNSVLGADLYIEGDGLFLVDNLRSDNFVDSGKNSGIGFNLVVEDRFLNSESIQIKGKGGKVGLMVNSPYRIGVLKIDLSNWELKPGLFNAGGFQTRQNSTDPRYGEFVKIHP